MGKGEGLNPEESSADARLVGQLFRAARPAVDEEASRAAMDRQWRDLWSARQGGSSGRRAWAGHGRRRHGHA